MTQNPQPPYRQLRRSQTDRKVSGVCAGVAEYFGIDPNVVRLLFIIISVLTGGVFAAVYILALIVMPDSPVPPPRVWTPQPQDTPPAP